MNTLDNKRKNNMDGSGLDNRTEGVSVIKTGNLGISFGNRSSFESRNGSIRKIFGPKHPF